MGGGVGAGMDLRGAICAKRHTCRVCVTASMDALHFIEPIHVGDIVVLHAQVNYTHKTSLEVGVRVEAEKTLTGERRHAASAYLTFVALDDERRPVPVPPLKLATPDEKRRFAEAEGRRARRLEWRARKK